MLNKDEELRVASFIDCLRDDVNKGREDADLAPSTLPWLALKLKETNDELKDVYEEIALHARAHPEVYKNPKNEISDRFYPRD